MRGLGVESAHVWGPVTPSRRVQFVPHPDVSQLFRLIALQLSGNQSLGAPCVTFLGCDGRDSFRLL